MVFLRSIPLFVVAWATVSSSVCRAQDFAIDDDGSRLLVAERGQPVLAYTYKVAADPAKPRAGLGGGYFHPIYGLYGEVLTGESGSNWSGAPGIQWVWSRLGADGKVVDLVRENGGRREFERVLGKKITATTASVRIQSVWLAGPEDRAQVLETVSFAVHPVVDSQRNIDVSVLLKNVAAENIYLTGGIPGAGLSFALSPERSDWSFSAGHGLVPTPGKALLSPLMICSYRDDRRSSRSGLAVFQDARNPGFSQPNWLVESPTRLLAGVSDTARAELKPGESLQFRYRLVLFHSSGADSEMTAEYSKFMAEGQRVE